MPPTPEEEDVPGERLPLTSVERISARQPSWRKRGAWLVLLALALSVVLGTIWSANMPGKRQASEATTAPIPLTVRLMSNLTNATITLNGKKLAGHPPLVVSADLETDDVTIAAPLFRPHTCHFKGLVTTDPAHCLFTSEDSFGTNVYGFTLGVCLTPDDLLPAQRDQFLAPPMQRAAVQQTTVQPGDYIATAFAADSTITSQHASRPLRASALLAQAGPQASLSFSCEQLLAEPFIIHQAPPYPPAGQVWGLLLNLVPRWRFTDTTGTTIADVTYQPGDVDKTFLFYLQFTYDATGWQLLADTSLNIEIPYILCGAGEHILQDRLRPISDNYGSMEVLANRGVEGCLLSLQADACKGCPPSAQAGKGDASFLWRFGVLLAADANAHAILPDLPIASQAAITAVSGQGATFEKPWLAG